MDVTKQTILGKWHEYTLVNDEGMSVSILNYGGIITRIQVPDYWGQIENVVLGYKNYSNYEKNPNFFGALIGPVAGRIQNATFNINDKTYSLETNEGNNHLHGGTAGFHHITWQTKAFQTGSTVDLKLTHTTINGKGGYPGNLDVAITYTLDNNNRLIIDYAAKTDHKTPVTLTNHSYFNLSGNLKRTIHNHEITMNSQYFAELDYNMIPTGKLSGVSNTPFDFQQGKKLSEGIEQPSKQNQIAGGGYDHFFMFRQNGDIMVRDRESKVDPIVKTQI